MDSELQSKRGNRNIYNFFYNSWSNLSFSFVNCNDEFGPNIGS